MNNPKYTFLLPAYKAKFFAEALASIKNQTFKDFKVIVSDDCSPEDLKSVFVKVIGDDSRFVFRRNEVNMGGKSLVSHWNLLVDLCDTEYLIMASDDDVYKSNFLDCIDKLCKKYPKTYVFRGRSQCIDGDGNNKGCEEQTSEWMDNLHFIHRIYQKDWQGGIASFVYNTEMLKSIGKFVDFPLAWFSDDVTNFAMAKNGCCITSDVSFKVRNSDIQISSKWGDPIDSLQKMKATYMNYYWMKKYMDSFIKYEDFDFLQVVTREYKYKIYTNIQNYIYHCKLFDFFEMVFRCPSDLGLSKARMIAHYMRGKLHV